MGRLGGRTTCAAVRTPNGKNSTRSSEREREPDGVHCRDQQTTSRENVVRSGGPAVGS